METSVNNSTRSGRIAAFVIALLIAVPVLAHHANSAYDRERTISVTGVVTRWQFINPHAVIFLNVTDD